MLPFDFGVTFLGQNEILNIIYTFFSELEQIFNR